MRFVYDHNIAPVNQYITVHEGDLLRETWNEKPIEILFSDVAKGLHLNDYILTKWLPFLSAGTGILIQQDQVREYHIWVAVTMEILAEYFEVLDYVMYKLDGV